MIARPFFRPKIMIESHEHIQPYFCGEFDVVQMMVVKNILI